MRAEALAKMEAMGDKIGYPEKFQDYTSVTISRRTTSPTWRTRRGSRTPIMTIGAQRAG